MDDVTSLISDTQTKICDAINNSRLHPAIIVLILENVLTKVQAIIPEKAEGENADNNP